MWIKKLIIFCICLNFLALEPLYAQQEINNFYQPEMQTKRNVPPALNTTLWISAYTASIYLLSRLEARNIALGVFYFIPSMGPFYRWDPNTQSSDEFEIKGENIVFASLSAYNFLAVDPDKQESSEVFRDNIYANLSLWAGLWAYRKYSDSASGLFLPVATSNSFSLEWHWNF